MTKPSPTTAPAVPDQGATKKKRRRLTPEERIKEREAEIESIKATRREAIRKALDDVSDKLSELADRSGAAGMTDDKERVLKAIAVLGQR